MGDGSSGPIVLLDSKDVKSTVIKKCEDSETFRGPYECFERQLIGIDGRALDDWYGAYSHIPSEVEQPHDPASQEYVECRLPSTTKKDYYRRLYVILGRETIDPHIDAQFKELKSEEERVQLMLQRECEAYLILGCHISDCGSYFLWCPDYTPSSRVDQTKFFTEKYKDPAFVKTLREYDVMMYGKQGAWTNSFNKGSLMRKEAKLNPRAALTDDELGDEGRGNRRRGAGRDTGTSHRANPVHKKQPGQTNLHQPLRPPAKTADGPRTNGRKRNAGAQAEEELQRPETSKRHHQAPPENENPDPTHQSNSAQGLHRDPLDDIFGSDSSNSGTRSPHLEDDSEHFPDGVLGTANRFVAMWDQQNLTGEQQGNQHSSRAGAGEDDHVDEDSEEQVILDLDDEANRSRASGLHDPPPADAGLEEVLKSPVFAKPMEPISAARAIAQFDAKYYPLATMAQTILWAKALSKRPSPDTTRNAAATPVSQSSSQSSLPTTPAWKTAMNLLKFKLPLRTAKEVLEAEAHLHDLSNNQFSILRNFLKYLLEENMRVGTGGEENHSASNILSNALVCRFDMAALTVFTYEKDSSDGRKPSFAGKEWDILKPKDPDAAPNADTVYYRPNLNQICQYLTSAYYKALEEYARKTAGEPEPAEEQQVAPKLDKAKMKKVAKGMTEFCRASRSSIENRWLTGLDLRQSGMTANTMTQSLMDDLKLFADAMLKRLGDDYFLYTKSSTFVKNAVAAIPSAGDWKAAAARLLNDADQSAGDEAAGE